MKNKFIAFYLLLFITVSDLFFYISNSGNGESYFTTVSLIIKYLALLLLVYFSFTPNNEKPPRVIALNFKLLLAWNIFEIFRGGILAKSYWDWKFLLFSSTLFLLVPLAYYIGINRVNQSLVFKYVLKYLFPLGFFLIPLSFNTNSELYSRLMVPVTLFILFIPFLKKRLQILIIVVALTSVILVVDFRTNLIKILASFAILAIYYLSKYFKLRYIKVAHLIACLVPIVLLYLGLSGQYNIFSQASKNEGFIINKNLDSEESLTADTRTFLYVEVLTSLGKNNNLIIGEGASGKYETNFFDYMVDDRKRYGSEVGLLNTLLYSGLIGFLLYGCFLFICSYYAIYKSNNYLCKMLGLFIVVRWDVFFIEDFTQFDLNFFFLWIVLGMVSSNYFRMKDDLNIKEYFNFNRRKFIDNDIYSHSRF